MSTPDAASDRCCEDPASAHAGCAGSAPGTPTLDEESAADLAGTLKVLADPVRLRLLELLATSPSGEVCACDLVEPLGRSQPTVSHHLKVLREAGLVRSERRGTWIWYSVCRPEVHRTLLALQKVTGLDSSDSSDSPGSSLKLLPA